MLDKDIFIRLLLLTTLMLPLTGTAEIYKWVDDSGRIHFGDSPRDKQNAEPIKLKINSYKHVTYETVKAPENGSGKPTSNKVTMYSTSWCGYCKKARRYFKKNRIAFVEHDIEKNKSAKKKFDAFGGTGVPLILVGNSKMRGFNVATFEKLYNRSKTK